MTTYGLKQLFKGQVSIDTAADIMTVIQGFTSGETVTPISYGMLAGDTIIVTVTGYQAKGVNACNAEVLAAVNAFIANKYPSI